MVNKKINSAGYLNTISNQFFIKKIYEKNEKK